jgi:ATP-binding cassette subfamily B protein
MDEIDTKKVFRFMYRESFKTKRLWWSVLLMPIAALCIGTALPYISSHILAQLAQHGADFNWLHDMLAFVVIATVGAISNRYGFLSLLSSQAHTLERVHNDMLDKLLQKSTTFFANRMSGKIISDGISLDSAIIQFQDLLAINALPFVLNILAGLIIVSLQSTYLGLGLLVITLTVFASAVYSSNQRSKYRAARHEAARTVRGNFSDVITNNQTVKVFAQEGFELEKQAGLARTLTEHRLKDWILISKNGNNRIITVLTLQLLFIGLVLMVVRDNPGALAAGIFGFTFSLNLTNKLFDITNMIRSFENAITDAYPMIDIMSEKPGIIDVPHAPRLVVKRGSIEFDNVDFHYEDSRKQNKLFNQLTLGISAGEKIGLVGHSGGGKTTVTKLILRLMDIQDGAIKIDGQDIARVTQESLRSAISYVPQEPLLFHRTIAENIAYGKPSATPKQIIVAADKAFAGEFIKTLPLGYDTLVGERGVKLSGGQRQRIAIARAILKDAPILVLDEATSALDSESEVLIQKALWKLMEGRTAIVIAHRLSTIQKMDRIIVLDEGKIVEEGSHNQLLKKKGKYAELWAHQSGGFIED